MEKNIDPAVPSVDENGIFDIEDDAIIAEIAGGLSSAPTVLDNGCTHNKSECGVSK